MPGKDAILELAGQQFTVTFNDGARELLQRFALIAPDTTFKSFTARLNEDFDFLVSAVCLCICGGEIVYETVETALRDPATRKTAVKAMRDAMLGGGLNPRDDDAGQPADEADPKWFDGRMSA
jgi:hypothetical protein